MFMSKYLLEFGSYYLWVLLERRRTSWWGQPTEQRRLETSCLTHWVSSSQSERRWNQQTYGGVDFARTRHGDYGWSKKQMPSRQYKLEQKGRSEQKCVLSGASGINCKKWPWEEPVANRITPILKHFRSTYEQQMFRRPQSLWPIVSFTDCLAIQQKRVGSNGRAKFEESMRKNKKLWKLNRKDKI